MSHKNQPEITRISQSKKKDQEDAKGSTSKLDEPKKSQTINGVQPINAQIEAPIETSSELLTLSNSVEKLTLLIKSRTPNENEFASYQKMFLVFQIFQNEYQKMLEKTRDKLIIINEPEFPKVNFGSDMKSLQQSLETIKSRNGEFERFAYSKLSELREQNTQLMIVQNHMNK